MGATPYDTLASVYEWLVPDALLTPEGRARTFAHAVDGLAPGASVVNGAYVADGACGMEQPYAGTWSPDAERYAVLARRPAA